MLKDENGKTLLEVVGVRRRWKEYFKQALNEEE